MKDTQLIPIIYARVIIAAASRNAFDTKKILAGTDFNSQTLRELNAGITVDDYRRLLSNAKAITGNPSIILDAGANVPPTVHGALGIAVSSSPDRMAILNLGMRFIKLRGFFCTIRVDKKSDETHCFFDIAPSLGEEKDTALDFILAVMMKLLMFSTLFPSSTPTIKLTRKKPLAHGHYERTLGATILYEQSEDCMICDTEVLALPTPFYDPEQYQAAVKKCRMLFLDEVKPSSTREAVELSFEKSPGMLWTLKQTAKDLHVSTRTLQRRLKTEGTNYQQMVDDWLKVLAAKYMNTEKLSVEATTTLLGYNDEANFRRAFKRWHGCSPQVYRQKHTAHED